MNIAHEFFNSFRRKVINTIFMLNQAEYWPDTFTTFPPAFPDGWIEEKHNK